MRPAALLALAPLLMRSRSSAFLMSPPASVSAVLHSIIASPVISRSSFTRLALISAISRCSLPLQVEKKGRWAPFWILHGRNRLCPPRLLVARFLFHLDEFVARGGDHFL